MITWLLSRKDRIVTAATETVILTGLFTLGGVLLASIFGVIGSMLRRRWAKDDALTAHSNVEQSALRTERRKIYSELLDAFNRHANASLRLDERVRTDPGAKDWTFRDTLNAHGTGVDEDVERLALSALLVANDRVAGLIREVDRELTAIFARSAHGAEPRHDDYMKLRLDLIRAMRDEVAPLLE